MILIKRIEIQNFRSIISQDIELNNLNIFVGKNDAGKSNLLKALNLFFNNKTDRDQDFSWENDYCKMASKRIKKAEEIKITLHFTLPNSYSIKDVKWTKSWRADGLYINDKFPQKNHSKSYAFLDRIKFKYIPAVKSTDYFKSLLSELYKVLTGKVSNMTKELNNLSASLGKITRNLSVDLKTLLDFESVLQMPQDLTPIFRDLVFKTNDLKNNSLSLSKLFDKIIIFFVIL